MRWLLILLMLTMPLGAGAEAQGKTSKPAKSTIFAGLSSPILFQGDAATAYRDPAAIYHDGVFHLYFTYANLDADGGLALRTAQSESRDLTHWTKPDPFTPCDRKLNYSSPGNVVRFNNQWLLCLQTYPTPNGEHFGNKDSRLWTMRSADLVHWGEPKLLRVKGPGVPVDQMGRMIDPYLIEDRGDPGKWWCFFKQNGVSWSWSRDLEHWNDAGHMGAGENVCILHDGSEYIMFHSPANGIGVKRSKDLKSWRDDGLLTLGQREWPWAQGRLTAGCVLDLRQEPGIGKYVMFFHGESQAGRKVHDAHGQASLGVAWSDDLKHWDWPGKTVAAKTESGGLKE